MLNKKVSDVMNPDVLLTTVSGSADMARDVILGFEITAMPVIGTDGALVGVVSLRDLTGPLGDETVAGRATMPATSVSPNDSVATAGELMCSRGLRHTPVVDARGSVVGMLSLFDVTRSLLGMPVEHPATFSNYDAARGLWWSASAALTAEEVMERAPDGPGALMVLRASAREPDTLLHTEGANNVRTRLLELVADPAARGGWSGPNERLWFRTAAPRVEA